MPKAREYVNKNILNQNILSMIIPDTSKGENENRFQIGKISGNFTMIQKKLEFSRIYIFCIIQEKERSESCHSLHLKSQEILWRIFRCMRPAERLLRSRRSCWDHRVPCIAVQMVLPPVKLNEIQKVFRQNFHCWTFCSEGIVLKQMKSIFIP